MYVQTRMHAYTDMLRATPDHLIRFRLHPFACTALARLKGVKAPFAEYSPYYFLNKTTNNSVEPGHDTGIH